MTRYKIHLKTEEHHEKQVFNISNASFTLREIDILSTLLSGRSAKSIAQILDLSYKTVETHIRNIFQKLSAHSREDVINLVEKSNCLNLYKNHYIRLRKNLEKSKLFDKIKTKLEYNDKILRLNLDNNKTDFSKKLLSDLDLLNINYKTKSKNPEKQNENHIYLNLISEEGLNFVTFNIISEDEEKDRNLDYDNFLIKLISLFINIDAFKEDIDNYLNIKYENDINHKRQIIKNTPSPAENIISVYIKYYVALFISIIVLVFYIFSCKSYQLNNIYLIPEKTIVERKNNLSELKIYFENNSNQESNPVAIIWGIGGSGKTTMASYYASKLKSDLIWQLNAKSYKSLSESFYSLLDAMSAYNEDIAKEYKRIIETSRKKELTRNLFNLIQSKLINMNNWILIFNDVEEDLGKVLSFLPLDKKLSGNGKIIITTRNDNISLSLPNAANINISELNKEAKYKLFTQIYDQDKNSHFTKKDIENIIDNLPPYPLDISAAAYYTKISGVTSDEYIKAIKSFSDQHHLEKEILDITGTYSLTRKEILSLSIDRIIQEDEEYKEILYLLSLMKYENIPCKLIAEFYHQSKIDKLIFSLKKHSFITKIKNKNNDKTFSLHVSFHEFLNTYLSKNIPQNEKENYIQKFSELQKQYIIDHLRHTPKSKEEYKNQINFINQMKVFLDNVSSDMKKLPYELIYRVGNKIYILGDLKASEKLLLLADKKMANSKNRFVHSNIRTTLAAIYTNQGLYQKSIEYSLLALQDLKNPTDRQYNQISSTYSHLADSYRAIGDYEKAKYYNVKSYELFKNRYAKHNRVNDKKSMHFASVFLGSFFNEIGRLKDAEQLLTETIKFNEENGHIIRKAWALTYLGQNQLLRNKHIDAAKSLNYSYELFKSIYGDYGYYTLKVRDFMGLNLAYLGDIEKGRLILLQNLDYYQKNYKIMNVNIAYILNYLATLEEVAQNREDARKYYENSLEIFNELNHPKANEIKIILQNRY